MTGTRGVGDRDSAVIAAYEKEFEQPESVDRAPSEEFRKTLEGKHNLFLAYTNEDFLEVKGRILGLGVGEHSRNHVTPHIRSLGLTPATDSLPPGALSMNAGSWTGLQALARHLRQSAASKGSAQEEPQVEAHWLDAVNEEDRPRFILDVHYLMTKLELFLTRRQAKIWMESFNKDLVGRPIDVVALRSAAEVLYAIEALEQVHY